MFQKEVADRIRAQPNTKAYGRLSIITQWLCHVKKLFDVKPQSFFPAPKITSTVLHLTPKSFNNTMGALMPKVEKVTHLFFQNRRKMLRAIFKKYDLDPRFFEKGYASILPQQRPENLTIEQYIEIAKQLSL